MKNVKLIHVSFDEVENFTPLDASTEWKLATPIACTTGAGYEDQ